MTKVGTESLPAVENEMRATLSVILRKLKNKTVSNGQINGQINGRLLVHGQINGKRCVSNFKTGV